MAQKKVDEGRYEVKVSSDGKKWERVRAYVTVDVALAVAEKVMIDAGKSGEIAPFVRVLQMAPAGVRNRAD